jgi:hypothetical protein
MGLLRYQPTNCTQTNFTYASPSSNWSPIAGMAKLLTGREFQLRGCWTVVQW